HWGTRRKQRAGTLPQDPGNEQPHSPAVDVARLAGAAEVALERIRRLPHVEDLRPGTKGEVHFLIDQVEVEIGFPALAVLQAQAPPMRFPAIEEVPGTGNDAILANHERQPDLAGKLADQLQEKLSRKNFDFEVRLADDRLIETMDFGRVSLADRVGI